MVNDDDVPIEELDRRIDIRMRADSAMLRRASWRPLPGHTGIWDHPDIGHKTRAVAIELTAHYKLAKGGKWPRAWFPGDVGPLIEAPGKVCRTCKIHKRYECFSPEPRRADGWRAECRDCRNAYDRTHRPIRSHKAGAARMRLLPPVAQSSGPARTAADIPFRAADVRANAYPGDSLPDIARRLDVAPRDLVEWAALDPAGAEPILRLINAMAG